MDGTACCDAPQKRTEKPAGTESDSFIYDVPCASLRRLNDSSEASSRYFCPENPGLRVPHSTKWHRQWQRAR